MQKGYGLVEAPSPPHRSQNHNLHQTPAQTSRVTVAIRVRPPPSHSASSHSSSSSSSSSFSNPSSASSFKPTSQSLCIGVVPPEQPGRRWGSSLILTDPTFLHATKMVMQTPRAKSDTSHPPPPLLPPPSCGRQYTFDHVWAPRSLFLSEDDSAPPHLSSHSSSAAAAAASDELDQADIYETLGVQALRAAWEGVNACIFAYGQTGSGKTHTMSGGSTTAYVPGLIPRICAGLFKAIGDVQARQEGSDEALFGKGEPDGHDQADVERGFVERTDFAVSVQYMEIYNEQVRDLIPAGAAAQPLRVRERVGGGMFVEGLSLHPAPSGRDVSRLLKVGERNRKTSQTLANDTSSRSHSIFVLLFEAETSRYKLEVGSRDGRIERGETPVSTRGRRSKLNLVDLAGSERVKSSGAKGATLNEATSINKSLSCLGDVIRALAAIKGAVDASGGDHFVPYRNSTLTHVLKESLGGNSVTAIIATIAPTAASYEETLSTIKFAERGKRVQVRAFANAYSSGGRNAALDRLVETLREEVKRLKEEKDDLRREMENFRNRSFVSRPLLSLDTTLDDDNDHESATSQRPTPSGGPQQKQQQQQNHLLRQQLAWREREFDGEITRQENAIRELEMQRYAAATPSLVDDASQPTPRQHARVAASGEASSTKASVLPPPTPVAPVPSGELPLYDPSLPRLVNLNPDPLFTESLFYPLPPGMTTIGCALRSNIRIGGAGVIDRHAVIAFDPESGVLWISAVSQAAKTLVNGRSIPGGGGNDGGAAAAPRIGGTGAPAAISLCDGARLRFGRDHFFRLDFLGAGGRSALESDTVTRADWEFAKREVALVNAAGATGDGDDDEEDVEVRLSLEIEQQKKGFRGGQSTSTAQAAVEDSRRRRGAVDVHAGVAHEHEHVVADVDDLDHERTRINEEGEMERGESASTAGGLAEEQGKNGWVRSRAATLERQQRRQQEQRSLPTVAPSSAALPPDFERMFSDLGATPTKSLVANAAAAEVPAAISELNEAVETYSAWMSNIEEEERRRNAQLAMVRRSLKEGSNQHSAAASADGSPSQPVTPSSTSSSSSSLPNQRAAPVEDVSSPHNPYGYRTSQLRAHPPPQLSATLSGRSLLQPSPPPAGGGARLNTSSDDEFLAIEDLLRKGEPAAPGGKGADQVAARQFVEGGRKALDALRREIEEVEQEKEKENADAAAEREKREAARKRMQQRRQGGR